MRAVGVSASVVFLVVALLAARRYRRAQRDLERIKGLPEERRDRAFQIATGIALPEGATAHQWVQSDMETWSVVRSGSIFCAVMSVLLLVVPTRSCLPQMTVQELLAEGSRRHQVRLSRFKPTPKPTQRPQPTRPPRVTAADPALAELVRLFEDVDQWQFTFVIPLDGGPIGKLEAIPGAPSMLCGGDAMTFRARARADEERSDGSVVLELGEGRDVHRVTVGMTGYDVPGDVPSEVTQPVKGVLLNESGTRGYDLDVHIISRCGIEARNRFRNGVREHPLAEAREIFREVGDRGLSIHMNQDLRGPDATLPAGSFVLVREHGNPCRVSARPVSSGPVEGWVDCSKLGEVRAPIEPGP